MAATITVQVRTDASADWAVAYTSDRKANALRNCGTQERAGLQVRAIRDGVVIHTNVTDADLSAERAEEAAALELAEAEIARMEAALVGDDTDTDTGIDLPAVVVHRDDDVMIGDLFWVPADSSDRLVARRAAYAQKKATGPAVRWMEGGTWSQPKHYANIRQARQAARTMATRQRKAAVSRAQVVIDGDVVLDTDTDAKTLQARHDGVTLSGTYACQA